MEKINIETIKEKKDEIFLNKIVERLDFYDILILKKFYLTEKKFPNDVQAYCFPILYKELQTQNSFKLTQEALRKRLKVLIKLGLLEKIKGTNPSLYLPVREKENFVRNLIKKFFSIYGFENLVSEK